MGIIIRQSRGHADRSPKRDETREVKTRSDSGQNQIGWDLSQDVADKQDGDGGVELGSHESEIGLETLHTRRAGHADGSVLHHLFPRFGSSHSRKRISIQVVEHEQDEQGGQEPKVDLADELLLGESILFLG